MLWNNDNEESKEVEVEVESYLDERIQDGKMRYFSCMLGYDPYNAINDEIYSEKEITKEEALSADELPLPHTDYLKREIMKKAHEFGMEDRIVFLQDRNIIADDPEAVSKIREQNRKIYEEALKSEGVKIQKDRHENEIEIEH